MSAPVYDILLIVFAAAFAVEMFGVAGDYRGAIAAKFALVGGGLLAAIAVSSIVALVASGPGPERFNPSVFWFIWNAGAAVAAFTYWRENVGRFAVAMGIVGAILTAILLIPLVTLITGPIHTGSMTIP